jgi:hypothetical protein
MAWGIVAAGTIRGGKFSVFPRVKTEVRFGSFSVPNVSFVSAGTPERCVAGR